MMQIMRINPPVSDPVTIRIWMTSFHLSWQRHSHWLQVTVYPSNEKLTL